MIRNIKKYIKSAKIEKEILCDIMNEIDNLKHSNEENEEDKNEVDLETVDEELKKKKKRSIQEIQQSQNHHHFKRRNQEEGYESIIQYFSSFYIDSTFYSLGF